MRYKESGRVIRALWAHTEKKTMFVIDINDDYAFPVEFDIKVLWLDLTEGRAEIIDDPCASVIAEENIKESHRARRDRARDIIAPIVVVKPNCFYSDQRWVLVEKVDKNHKCGHRTIYRYLRRYWQCGQKWNALLPNYAKSGAKGVERPPGAVKRGRPRKYTDNFGVNITKEMRQTFRVAVARYYVSNKRFSMKDCHKEMLRDFFSKKHIDPYDGYITIEPIDGNDGRDRPTFDQFQYWVDKDNDRLEMRRRRMSPRVYDKDFRGLTSSSNTEVWGPGARFQIDATIADVYIVSKLKRNKIIGRPVIYIVIDVYSRMIVGLYVGIENPSWAAAMMAIANTVSDKQAFCKQFGIDIEAHEWPCHHMPAVILGDGGEIAGHIIDTLINNYHVKVETTAPYRGDWKGIVEQRFRLLPVKFGPYVDGYVQVDYKERGAKDYRLDATLDIDQFTKIIIHDILYYNNIHELSKYDKDHDLATADFSAVPIDLWEWGIANKSGSLRRYDPEMVKFSLMPTATASVTEFGIQFKGSYYSCARAIEERWFDQARISGRSKVTVSYDLRDLDNLYLHDTSDPSRFDVLNRTQRSRAYEHQSGWDIMQAEFSSKQRSSERAPRQQTADIELAANTEAIVKEARAMKPSTKGQSARSRTSAIRENRAAEQSVNRQAEAFRLGDAAKPPIATSVNNVVPFPISEEDDFSEPDITQILNADKEDQHD